MIYLDTNIIIYAIENNLKYGNSCKKILSDIESNKLKAGSSTIVLVEIINVLTKINKVLKEKGEKELNIRDNVDAVLSLPIIWFDLNFFIVKKAAEYDYNVSGIDYIHLASMEVNWITKIISADKELDKVDFIKRLDPVNYK